MRSPEQGSSRERIDDDHRDCFAPSDQRAKFLPNFGDVKSSMVASKSPKISTGFGERGHCCLTFLFGDVATIRLRVRNSAWTTRCFTKELRDQEDQVNDPRSAGRNLREVQEPTSSPRDPAEEGTGGLLPCEHYIYPARNRGNYFKCLMVGKMWCGKAARREAILREVSHHLVPALFGVAVTNSGNCQRTHWHNRHQAMAFPRRIDDVEVAVVLNHAGVGVFGFRLTT